MEVRASAATGSNVVNTRVCPRSRWCRASCSQRSQQTFCTPKPFKTLLSTHFKIGLFAMRKHSQNSCTLSAIRCLSAPLDRQCSSTAGSRGSSTLALFVCMGVLFELIDCVQHRCVGFAWILDPLRVRVAAHQMDKLLSSRLQKAAARGGVGQRGHTRGALCVCCCVYSDGFHSHCCCFVE